MKPAFETTAIMPEGPAAWAAPDLASLVRVLQAAGATLALLSLGLGGVIALLHPASEQLTLAALACAAMGLVLLREGTAMQARRDAGLGRIDPSSGLYNRAGLIRAGEVLLDETRAAGKALAVVVLDFDDLVEVRNIYGRETSRKLLAHVVRRMRAVCGSRGLAARTGAGQFTLVLPGMQPQQARAAVERVLGKPSRIEFDAGDSEIVLVPSILCDCIEEEDAATSVAQLQRSLAARLAEQRDFELRRCQYLQRSRERHSRPMSLPPSRL
ncbi:MAG TPA: diguanylate cyclase [Ramlibacter sp.]|uniref:GGDEF domain-containing protein n=1 Tax=Ramlibacter sp. TaxID=1917967 RepID=UPI002B94E7DF|nr:diguanylate cyclase [Ramlibacter sp.]HVZ43027.1 diguanylate cyclase [Ramlibacter sp.]